MRGRDAAARDEFADASDRLAPSLTFIPFRGNLILGGKRRNLHHENGWNPKATPHSPRAIPRPRRRSATRPAREYRGAPITHTRKARTAGIQSCPRLQLRLRSAPSSGAPIPTPSFRRCRPRIHQIRSTFTRKFHWRCSRWSG